MVFGSIPAAEDLASILRQPLACDDIHLPRSDGAPISPNAAGQVPLSLGAMTTDTTHLVGWPEGAHAEADHSCTEPRLHLVLFDGVRTKYKAAVEGPAPTDPWVSNIRGPRQEVHIRLPRSVDTRTTAALPGCDSYADRFDCVSSRASACHQCKGRGKEDLHIRALSGNGSILNPCPHLDRVPPW